MIKKIIFSICLLLGINGYAQEIEIPAKVLSTFQEKYPTAKKVEWKQLKDTFHAEYFDFYQSIAIFSSDGLWIKTISFVSEDNLPKKAIEYIDESFDPSQIKQIQMIVKNNWVISYIIVIQDENKKITIEFLKDGTLVRLSI